MIELLRRLTVLIYLHFIGLSYGIVEASRIAGPARRSSELARSLAKTMGTPRWVTPFSEIEAPRVNF